MPRRASTRISAISKDLLVFAWNLRSLTTEFERQSLALNTIERGRAWHWRLLPLGWANPAFIFRHGQLKTKGAFATFFPSLKRTDIRERMSPMKIKKKAAGEEPVAWETVKVAHFADLIDAKISALSTRGFARDLVDLYAAHKQKQLNWRALFLNASRNQLNDYNPVELENNLKLIEQDLKKGTQDLQCSQPPCVQDLTEFLQALRVANAEVARELTQGESEIGID